MTETRIKDLMRAARALLDAVSFDDNGDMIAGEYRGGNGGLISRETIKKADTLRLVLDQNKDLGA